MYLHFPAMFQFCFLIRWSFLAIFVIGSILYANAQVLTYSSSIDVSSHTPSYEGISTTVAAQEIYNTGIAFSADGLTVCHIGYGAQEIMQHSLSTPFDLSGGLAYQGMTDTLPENETTFGSNDYSYQGMCFNSDGTKVYVVSSGFNQDYDGAVQQYSLSTPYKVLDGMTYEGIFQTSHISAYMSEVSISADGSLMYFLDATHDDVKIYSLTTPNDITGGMTYVEDFSIGTSCYDMTFSPDGLQVFFAGFNLDGIYQYRLSTPFDLTSSTTYIGYYKFAINLISAPSIAISPDGTTLFVLNRDGDFYQLSLNGSNVFKETVSNDGSVNGEMIISLDGANFTNPGSNLSQGIDYEITNLPVGLTSTLAIDASGTVAVLALTGSAISHTALSDIQGLEFTFMNSAFEGLNASQVTNAIAFNSMLGISFDDRAHMDFVSTIAYGESNTQDILDVDAYVIGQGTSDEDVTYSLQGDDANNFSINATTGVISFLISPDYENPIDANSDNTYEIDVVATYITDTVRSLSIVIQDKVESLIYSSDLDLGEGLTSYDGYSLDLNGRVDGVSGFIINEEDSLAYVSNSYNDFSVNVYKLFNGKDFTEGSSFLQNYQLPDGSVRKGIRFNHNGTKIYGSYGNYIYQYSVTDPYDLSSEISLEYSFYYRDLANITNLEDFLFSPDGSKLYLLGTNTDKIYQLALLNPFELESQVQFEVDFAVPGFASCMWFSNSGMSLFIADYYADELYEYELSTPFDLTLGASLDSQFDISSFTTRAFTLAFSKDEEKLFLGDNNADHVYQFSLNNVKGFSEDGGNPGAVTGAANLTLSGGIHFENKSGNLIEGTHFDIPNLPQGLSASIAVNADGTFGILTLSGNATAHNTEDGVDNLEFVFYDIAFSNSNASDIQNTINALSGFSVRFDSKPDFFIPSVISFGDGKSNTIIDVDALAPGASTVDENVTYSISGSDAILFSIDLESGELQFNSSPDYYNPEDSDGDNLYHLDVTAASSGDSTRSVVIEVLPFSKALSYSLPMDLSTPELSYFQGSLSVKDQDEIPNGMTFSNDGLKLFLIGLNKTIYQYALDTAFEISTANYESSLNISGYQATPQSLSLSPSGDKLYVIGGSPNAIHEFKFSGETDISSGLNFVASLNLPSEIYLGAEAIIDPSGSKLFILEFITKKVLQYELNLPFSIAGDIEFVTEFALASTPRGMVFSPDGSQMFITGQTNKTIEQFSLDRPFDLTNSVTQTGTFEFNNLLVPDETQPRSLEVDAYGQRVYLLGNSLDKIHQFNLNVDAAFIETMDNIGEVEGTILVTISGDQFVNTGSALSSGSHFDILNSPAGLSPVISVNSSGTQAELTFSGNAIENSTEHSVDSLYFSFANEAFSNFSAGDVVLNANTQINLGILFEMNTVTGIFTNSVYDLNSPYPNPTTGVVNFREECDYVVTNTLGEQLSDGKGYQVELSYLPTGVYVIKTSKGNYRITKR